MAIIALSSHSHQSSRCRSSNLRLVNNQINRRLIDTRKPITNNIHHPDITLHTKMAQSTRRRITSLHTTTLPHTAQHRNTTLEGRSFSRDLAVQEHDALVRVLIGAGTWGEVGLGRVAVLERCTEGHGAGFDLACGGIEIVVLRGEGDA